MCVYVWFCNPWDCSLSCWPLLTSSCLLHSVCSRNLFFPTVATVYVDAVWLMCFCHKTRWYTLQKTENIPLAKFKKNFLCTLTTKCKRVQATKVSQTFENKNNFLVCFLERLCICLSCECVCYEMYHHSNGHALFLHFHHLVFCSHLALLYSFPVFLSFVHSLTLSLSLSPSYDWQVLLRLDPCMPQPLSL